MRNGSLRVDDPKRRSVITSARKIIYNGHGVKSAAVEDLLKPLSLVPNQVRCEFDIISAWMNNATPRERFV